MAKIKRESVAGFLRCASILARECLMTNPLIPYGFLKNREKQDCNAFVMPFCNESSSKTAYSPNARLYSGFDLGITILNNPIEDFFDSHLVGERKNERFRDQSCSDFFSY